MKTLLISLSLLCLCGLMACTQESVVKNTALRHVVLKFDADLGKNTDPQAVKEIKKSTKIEVTDLQMISDKEAKATVTVKSVNPEKRTEPTFQQISVLVVKDNVWSVKE